VCVCVWCVCLCVVCVFVCGVCVCVWCVCLYVYLGECVCVYVVECVSGCGCENKSLWVDFIPTDIGQDCKKLGRDKRCSLVWPTVTKT